LYHPANHTHANMLFRIAISLALLFILSACSNEGEQSSGGRTSRNLIRVDLNLYTPGTIPMGIGEPNNIADDVAREWEALNPGMRIRYQQTVNPGTSEGEWLKTQLIGGVAPEIITQNAEVTWMDVDKGWYVPLDDYLEQPNPYIPGNERWIDSFTNQALVNAKRAPDGKLYCVPIDIVETGLFYNKTLLNSMGIMKLPETWAEMLEVFQTIQQESNITPFTADLNLASDWGKDILFEMLYHDILPHMDLIESSPEAQEYLGHYLEPREAGFLFSKGFFTSRDPRWRLMNEMLFEWRQYWARELKNSDPIRMFLTQRLAMYWSGSWFIRRMATDPYVNFEWGIMYIPKLTQETTKYASGTEATVIGGAAIQLHITNSALIKENLEACVDFLMWLSAPQNIERLASESLVYIPNIKGAEIDDRLEPFNEIFERRYCAIKWLESFDGEYKTYWRRMLDFYLEGGMTLDEYLIAIEGNFERWVESHLERGWDFSEMDVAWEERKDILLRELDPVR